MELPPSWVIQVLTAMVCAFGIIIWLFSLRGKYQKKAINHVLVTFIPESGVSYEKLLEIKDGFVTLPGNTKKGIKEKDYPVGSNACFDGKYPSGWCPKIIQTNIKCMVFREDTFEPIYNRGDSLLSPARLRNIRKEKFTEMGASHSLDESLADKKSKGKEKLSPSTVYFLLGIIGLGVVGMIGICLMRFNEIMEIINKLAQAAGV